jgi:hypothetical protein
VLRKEKKRQKTDIEREGEGGGRGLNRKIKNLISKFKLNLSKLLTPFLCFFQKSLPVLNLKFF